MANHALLQKPLYLFAVYGVAREAIYLPTNYSLRFAAPNAQHHVVENRATRNLCGFLFDKLFDDFQIVALRKRAKFGKLRLNRQNLFVLNIGTFASVEKIEHNYIIQEKYERRTKR
ncbi:MAG: hypothetical protein A2759_04155 [Candidatus Taylorbacteria bacterium RIFCSPHIGHO2_01_FULL_49_60]|nr:MAG: hypothetical protein A2759_04155 [Candidatus Taylorbacteria bacterium RIFCSPHIGHO2_01_FULL_49_60]OHA45859.1 MAG: hypothetical protein A3G61_03620 [Candidatus Taylorbacteria bacterium RIFCSPLOWO2_12_FULL_49_67]